MRDKMKKVIKVQYNYRQAVCDGSEVWPEDWDQANLEDEDVLNINEHLPMGEGDRYYCDIEYQNGETHRVFNMNKIVYKN